MAELRDAVIRYAAAHEERLPTDTAEVRPYLRPLPHGWNEAVTPEALLPHVRIVQFDGSTSLRAGSGRFLLLVRVLKAGPMKWDVVLVQGETGHEYQHLDAEIISALGQEQWEELKKASYRLP